MASRQKPARMEYVQRLIGNVQKAMREYGMINKLKSLFYGSGLNAAVMRQIQADNTGIVLL